MRSERASRKIDFRGAGHFFYLEGAPLAVLDETPGRVPRGSSCSNFQQF